MMPLPFSMNEWFALSSVSILQILFVFWRVFDMFIQRNGHAAFLSWFPVAFFCNFLIFIVFV